MWKAALSVRTDIEKRGILANAMKNPLYQGYNLLIVGHSLGAGTATLLSIMLRRQYPQLKCLAFSPPGGMALHPTPNDSHCEGLLTLPAARHCSRFVTSVVVGDDWISRLGRGSIYKLRRDIIFALSQVSSLHSSPNICRMIFPNIDYSAVFARCPNFNATLPELRAILC